ncbi:TPA: thermostable direct hemolysin-family toxin [Vibrio cholerae]|nr:thermostable direct hemolysin-family toxin [Vibrio cholerae]
MIKKLFLISAALSFHAYAIELPSIPFPSPGSDEIVFVVRNTTSDVEVYTKDYWSYRDIKRLPSREVNKQAIFSTSGYKWMTAFITVSINGNPYTMATLSGYRNGYATTYSKVSAGTLTHDYSSVESFVGENESNIIPNIRMVDETPDYFVTTESYESGNGHVITMCIANNKTLSQCLEQS